jgi:ubiquinone/menaquinone biosynthesis C-methylase UbiE
LIKRAQENSKIIDLNVDFHSWDVEDLPFEDASFDVVVSRFGHMFAHRPSVALSEMLRGTQTKRNDCFFHLASRVVYGELFSN